MEPSTAPSETTTTVQTEQAPPTTTSQEPPVPVRVATLPPNGTGAAIRLSAKPDCTATTREPFATLRWSPAADRGRLQRVVVTIYPDGFAQGRFEASQPLSPDRTKLEWRRVHGQAIHSWRVLTHHEDGWTASETGRFEGPVCAADYAGP